MNKYQQSLNKIDECFADIINNTDVEKNLSIIRLELAKMGHKIESISIVDPEGVFFGMAIYPCVSSLEQIIAGVVEGKPHKYIHEVWVGSPMVVEIDKKIIDKVRANNKELTACLLHEIGHVVYENTIINKIVKINRMLISNLDMKSYNILKKNKKLYSLFYPTVAQACRTKTYALVKREIKADRYPVKMGYGKHLSTLLDKMMANIGSSYISGNEEQEITVAGKWAIMAIQQLQFRKNVIEDKKEQIKMLTSSPYLYSVFDFMEKNLIKQSQMKPSYIPNIGTNLTVTGREELIPLVTESAMGSNFDKYGKVKKVTPQEIDILFIKAEQIQNSQDKIYLLDIVYEYIELSQLSLDLIENGSKDRVTQNKKQIENNLDLLSELRKKVLETKIQEKQYGIFIKYPEGYEG